MAESVECTRVQTRKSALGETRAPTLREDAVPAPGEALLRLSRFALTTNNITYAALGDSMLRYWSYFPTGDADWGHMPVWGFADVVASGVDGVATGERFYGYFPIATHLRMRPVRVSARGFHDGTPHRQELVSAYNQYTRCSTDPAWSAQREDLQMLLRPLFLTAWVLADFLADNAFFGARQVVVSSASSKTATGAAFCLREGAAPPLTAVTSARNVDFVRGLGCYDGVVAYDALASLPVDRPTLYVDFAGEAGLRERVHRHFGDALVYDCLVGSAQTTDFTPQTGLTGPEAKLFFAPDQIRKRNADWGPAEFTTRYNAAQARFFERVSSKESPWIRVETHRGFDAARRVIADLAAGNTDPLAGHVVLL